MTSVAEQIPAWLDKILLTRDLLIGIADVL